MLNIATNYLALLQEDDIEFRAIALEKLNMLIDDHWSEISDYIKTLKTFYTTNAIPNHQDLLALILSKLYYNLEDYDSAIEWALNSNSKFDINEHSLYVSTLLRKILDKYISIRKHNFYHQNDQQRIDPKIQNIVNAVFDICVQKGLVAQTIGFSVESFDLERLAVSIESTSLIKTNLKMLYDLIMDCVVNTEYKAAVLNQLLKLYIKHAGDEYLDISKCHFLLNDTDALANTLLLILQKEAQPITAYQIAFDLCDNQNPSYLRLLVGKLKLINNNNTNKVEPSKLEPLLKILKGDISRNLVLQSLSHKNHTDSDIGKTLVKLSDKSGTIYHLGVIIANSLMNSHTGNDSFLKENIQWVAKSTNWARFCSTASLGAIHMGDTVKGKDIMKPYLPGSSSSSSIYAHGGAFYGIGLIYANTNDEQIIKFLLDALNAHSNNKEAILHGIFLALGLVSMGSHDQNLYEKLRDGIYTDDAIIGEAAAYAVGLAMAGSRNTDAIDDLLKYAHDTQHEKIIRAISIALALIVYGAEEQADTLIESLSREKDPILRYGCMYCIGMAYAGSGNTTMLKKLIKVSVSDVSDDVRRAALINIGFLQIRDPDILFEKLKVISLLSESYNTHVRFGATMAIGISCAGSGKLKPYKVIEPLFGDPNYLVRQASVIASAMIFSQTTTTQEPGIAKFKENVNEMIKNKDEHALIRFGALISHGIMELGGKNCSLSLVSTTGSNKMSAIIGMALFTQYYYWFPMIHFINLAVSPTMIYGLDSTLQIVKNYKMLSKAKPSLYGYPIKEVNKESEKVKKTEAAVLSTHSRVKAKGRKTNTNTANVVELKEAQGGAVVEEEEKKKEENKEEEPLEEVLVNPIRVISRQRNVVFEIDGQDYMPIVSGRKNGFVMLRKVNDNATTEYEDFKPVPVETKKDEAKKEEEKKEEYNAIPNNDVEMPEDIDISNI